MEQKIILETERLFLREMNKDDFEKEYPDPENKITHVSVIFGEETTVA